MHKLLLVTIVIAALTACGNAVSSASNSTILCPTTGPVPSTRFCVTPQERALGQRPALFRTLPASLFIGAGFELTTSSSDVPRFTRSQLYTLLRQKLHMKVIEAVLVQWHGIDGNPPVGQLTWVVNDTPQNFQGVSGIGGGVAIPSGARSTSVPNAGSSSGKSVKHYEVITVNANTGKVTGAMST